MSNKQEAAPSEAAPWRRTDRVVAAEVGDSLVVLAIEDGRYYSLSETAYAVWRLLEQPREIAEICEELRGQYDVSADVCEMAVIGLLADLKGKNLVAQAATPR